MTMAITSETERRSTSSFGEV